MDWVARVCIVWLTVLIAALSIASSRHGSLVGRILWIDTLAVLLIALLAVIGYVRREAAYLDTGIVLALLAFAGTLAAARYHEEGRL